MTAITTEPTLLSRAETQPGTAERVLTGDRPTGPLHLGHYFGTLLNRVRLQQAGHELFLVIADYQVITDRDDVGDLPNRTLNLVLDYLSVGIDPSQACIFAHSQIPELNQLLLPFLSLVSTGELERNPTVKEESRLAGRSTVNGLMLTYPVHQAADILFCHAGLVPVGQDQLPHLEVARSIARRFNQRYQPVLTVPSALLSDTPVLLGTDGTKMAKSRGNAINLIDPDEAVIAKVMAAKTDSERRITYEPDRRPEVANLLRLAAASRSVAPVSIAEDVGDGGGRVLKSVVIDAVLELLRPIRARRAEFDRADARAILAAGAEQARTVATQTLSEVRTAMKMDY